MPLPLVKLAAWYQQLGLARVVTNNVLAFVLIFVIWFIVCAVNATFQFSLQTTGEEIMWREGIMEAINQTRAFKDYLQEQVMWLVEWLKGTSD